MLQRLASVLLLAVGTRAALVLHPTSAVLPFAVNVPTLAPPPYATILFLHGNGTNAGPSDLANHATWDGMGWLIGQYNSGNHTGAQRILVEEYLTILPLVPLGVRDWNPTEVLNVLAVASRTYELDASRIIISGYSMGAFGAFDAAFASPSTFSALIPSASGSGFSDTQLATLFSTTPPVSVYVLAGAQDEKQPVAGISGDQLRSLPGATAANITIKIFQGNNHLMTSEPFEDVGLWSWIADQRKGPSAIFNVNATTSTAASTSTVAAASSTTPAQTLNSGKPQIASLKSSGTASGSGAAASSTAAKSKAGRSLHILWW